MVDLRRIRWTVGLAVFAAGLTAFVACDTPSSAPSLDTETGIRTPVVVDKTFSFLGGPQSQNEPLVDTTTSQFDSLFTVRSSDQSISLEEEVSSFDVGSLDQAIDQATADVGAQESIAEAVLQSSNLATQTVETSFQRSNNVPPPTQANSTQSPVPPDGEVQFPSSLLEVPDFEVVKAENATVQRATLTDETTVDGTTVNELSFTLFNDPSVPNTLTDGMDGPPVVELEAPDGSVIGRDVFGSKVGPDESADAAINVADETIGENTTIALTIAGNDSQDELTTRISELRYQKAVLDNVQEVAVTATETNVSTRGGGASQFAGVTPESGTLNLEVTNNLSFPVEIDTLRLANNASARQPLPSDFPALDVLTSAGSPVDPIASGATRTVPVDLNGRGIAQGIDIELSGQSAQSGQTVPVSADGSVEITTRGDLTAQTLYFWPDGETVQVGGDFPFEQRRISFDQSEDFVELSGGTLSLSDFDSEPTVGFQDFTVSFPDIRRSPYAPGDSLSLRFTQNPSGDFEYAPIGPNDGPRDVAASLSDLRLSPTGNVVDYHLQGTLETIAPQNQTESTLRVIRRSDSVRTAVAVDELDVRALEATVNPFTVSVTEDANGDGQFSLANTSEARTASFSNFGGLAGTVDGLQLDGTRLDFQVTTDVGTNAQLYAALQGRQGDAHTFLAGTKQGGGRDVQAVASSDTLGDDFVDAGGTVPAENLIRFGLDGAPSNDPATQSFDLTDANSTVDAFISALPTSLRFVAQARLTGDDNGRIRLRRPLTFDAGLSFTVPLRFEGPFSVRDTVDADFSSLSDVTDPDQNTTLTQAELRIPYENGIPLGTDAQIRVLDGNENEVLTLPSDTDALRLQPAPKAEDGTAARRRSGTLTVALDEQEVRDLSAGRQLVLDLSITPPSDDGAVTVRADDPLQVSLRTRVKVSVSSGSAPSQ